MLSRSDRSVAAFTFRFVSLAVAGVLLWGCGDPAALPTALDVAPAVSGATAEPDRVVFPTGTFPADVFNVQDAVDLGGTVLLKATNAAGTPTAFNFGPQNFSGGGLGLSSDVTIAGETVPGGMTTIKGGFLPIYVFGRALTTIRGIFFDGPFIAAAYVIGTTGFAFTDSRVANVVPYFELFDPELGPIFKGQGIWVEGGRATSGTIAIEDNTFEDTGLNGAINGYGLAILPGGAQVRISRNTIQGANLAGIIVLRPRLQVLIEDNIIAPGPGDVDPPVYGLGIYVVGSSGLTGGVIARNNDIRVEGPAAHGVLFDGGDFFGPALNAVVENNRITVDEGWAGIGLKGTASHAQVTNNQIRGTGRYALLVEQGFDPGDAVSNAFRGNNIATFSASVADVFFDVNSISNSLVGHSGTVIDLGTSNQITGTPTGNSQGHGNRVRSAALMRSLQNGTLPDIRRP